MGLFSKIIGLECANPDCVEFAKRKPRKSSPVCGECYLPMTPVKKTRFTPLIIVFLLLPPAIGIGGLFPGWYAIPHSSKGTFGSLTRDIFSLKGNLYFLPSDTPHLPDFRKMKAVGTVYTRQLNIPQRNFTQGFPGVSDRFEWFGIEYTGTLLVDQKETFHFRLTSDDGSKLFIDNRLIVDNDGLHGTAARENSIELGEGLHSVRIQYFQGPRTAIALVLELAEGDEPYKVFNLKELGPFRLSPYWVKISAWAAGVSLLLGVCIYWIGRQKKKMKNLRKTLENF